MKPPVQRLTGFTLAEILIALGLLGVIAAFTIPKVLQSTGSSKATAVFKETASVIGSAFSTYALNNGLASGDKFDTFTTNPSTGVMNFVDTLTSGSMTTPAAGTLVACDASNPCVRTHLGSWIQYTTTNTFGGTANTNGISFTIDPDGTGGFTPVQMYLYANGKVTSRGTGVTAPVSGSGYTGTTVTSDPAYVNNWA